MITHKDSFAGAAGKLQNIGGSPIFTTPHTVDVPPEYSIGIDECVRGELVANSLDGRLWMFRDADSLGLVALNWNTSTGRLEFSAAKNFANNTDTVLARGIDWILTNNSIFLAVVSEPFIRSASLFAEGISSTFLYSLLRKGSVAGSGIDPFTGSAWGKRSDNGNSEGNGYFSKDTHLLYPAGSHIFEQCYSVLPAVGDWQLFENFLVRRPDAPLSDGYNGMLNVRPLIPLEFKDNVPYYGTGYNFTHRGIQLASKNGQLWARGLFGFGKAAIIPAVFDFNGEPQEFFLYISPDFQCSPFFKEDFDYNIFSYTTFEGHSFLKSTAPLTWLQAKEACEALGGHLATSTNEEKNNFLFSFAGLTYSGSTRSIWLGASREDNGQWAWVNGEAWSDSWARSMWNNSWRKYSPYDYLLMLPNKFWDEGLDSSTAHYICEWDSPQPPDDVTGISWLNFGVFPTGNNSGLGVYNELYHNFLGGGYTLPVQPQLFDPSSNSWLDLSQDNGSLFVDNAHSSALLLNDNGAQFIGGDSFDCRTLPLWLAPAGNVEAILDDTVISKAGDSLFATYSARGFHRNLLQDNFLPLSFGYSDSQASIDFDSEHKCFSLNRINGASLRSEKIAWLNIYKQPLTFVFLNTFEHDYIENVQGIPAFVGDVSQIYSIYFDASGHNGTVITPGTYVIGGERCYIYEWVRWDTAFTIHRFSNDFPTHYPEAAEYIANDMAQIYEQSHYIVRETSYGFFPRSVSANVFYISPETGEPVSSLNFGPVNFEQTISSNNAHVYYESLYVSSWETVSGVVISDGKIGLNIIKTSLSGDIYHGTSSTEEYLKDAVDIPSEIKDWLELSSLYSDQTEAPFVRLVSFSPQEHATFSAPYSNVLFTVDFSSMHLDKMFDVYSQLQHILDYPDSSSLIMTESGYTLYTRTLHVVIFKTNQDNRKGAFFVFRSEINTDFFELNFLP